MPNKTMTTKKKNAAFVHQTQTVKIKSHTFCPEIFAQKTLNSCDLFNRQFF